MPIVRAQGFMCMPWLSGQKGSFLREMHTWLRDGKVRRLLIGAALPPKRIFFEGKSCGVLFRRHRAMACRLDTRCSVL
jgi:hypothetical protein